MTANGEADDRLLVLHEGTGAGEVNVVGSTILIDGVQIATFTGGNGVGDDLLVTFDADADATDVEKVARRIAFRSVSENPSSAQRTISTTLTDGDGGTSATDTRVMNVVPVNDEELLATNTGTTVAEGSMGTVITTAMLHTTDVDNTDVQLVYTVDVIPTNGTIRLSGTALAAGQTFTQDDIDNNRVTYDHDGSQTTADNFDFTVDDGQGTDTSATFNFTVTNVNDAPVNTVPGAQNVNEDTPVNITGISVVDADDNLSTVQLSVGNGRLNVTLSGSASISSGANGSGDLTLSGSLADINATLASLSYQGNLNFNGSDTLTVLSTDSDSATDSDTVAITVGAVNDTPDVVGPGSAYSVNENTNLTIQGTGFGVTDVDAASGTMTATITVGEGDIALVAGDSGVSITANNASTVTFTGMLAQIDALLTGSGTGTITYNNGSDTPANSTTITVTVNDGGNTGTDPGVTADGSSEEDSASQTINITATNDDPTNDGSLPSDVTVTEDVLTSIDLSAVDFSDVDAVSSDLTVTLSTSTGGELTLAADGSIDFGGTATARTLTGTIAELNAYFSNTSNVQYLHGTQHTFGNDADTITVVINDNGNTGTGGGSDQTLGTVNVDITAVNDEEVLATNTGTTVAEGSNGNTVTTAMLETTDVDNTDVQLVYTVNAVPTNGTLRLSGTALSNGQTFTQADIDTGNVTYDHDGSQTSADSFDFTVDDGSGTDTSATFNFTVTNVNDAPVNTVPGAQTVDEDNSVSIIGISVADDDDNLSTVQLTVNNGTLNVTLSGSASISAGANASSDLTLSGSLADINATLASLTYQGNLNFNGSDTLTVLSTDSDSATDSDTVTINVGAINDAPTFNNLDGNPTYIEGGSPVVLDADVTFFDADIDRGEDDYSGISFQLVRNGGANADDMFSATGALGALSQAGSLTHGGTTIGTVTTNSCGVLVLTFNANATASLVNATLQSIAYSNSSDTPPATVQIDWSMNDSNTASEQGSGGDLMASGSTNVNIMATNDDPINAGSLPGDVGTAEDVLTPIDLSAVDFSDVDAGGGDLTVTLSTSTGGELTLASDVSIDIGGTATSRTLTGTLAELNAYFDNGSNIRYLHTTPHLNGDNVDSITVVINDNGNTGTGGGTDHTLGVVNVDIAAVNDTPLATADSATLFVGESILRDALQGVLANDVDIEGDLLNAVLVSGPSHGNLTLNPDGSWTYSPNGFIGSTTFQYAASDGSATSDPQVVTITVLPAAPPPPTETIPESSSDDSPNEVDEDDTDEEEQDDVIQTADGALIAPEQSRSEDSEGSQRDGVEKVSEPTLEQIETPELRLGGSRNEEANQSRSRVETQFQLRLGLLESPATSEFFATNAEVHEAGKLGIEETRLILSTFREEVATREAALELSVGTASSVFLAATAGVALWGLSGSYLASIMASSLPAWAQFDPIYITNSAAQLRKEDDQSLADLATGNPSQPDES